MATKKRVIRRVIKHSSPKRSLTSKLVFLGLAIALAGLAVSAVRAKFYGEGPLVSYFATHGGVFRIATNLEAPGTTTPMIAKVDETGGLAGSKSTTKPTTKSSNDSAKKAADQTAAGHSQTSGSSTVENYTAQTGVQGGTNKGMTAQEIRDANVKAAANGAVKVASDARDQARAKAKAAGASDEEADDIANNAYSSAYVNSMNTSNAQAAANEAYSAAGGDTATTDAAKNAAAKAAREAYADVVHDIKVSSLKGDKRCQDKAGNSIGAGEIVVGNVSGGSDTYFACNGNTGGWVNCNKIGGCTAVDVTVLPTGYKNYGGITGNNGKPKCWSGKDMYQDGDVAGNLACHDGEMKTATAEEKAAANANSERMKQIQDMADKVARCKNDQNKEYEPGIKGADGNGCVSASAKAAAYAPTSESKKKACDDGQGYWTGDKCIINAPAAPVVVRLPNGDVGTAAKVIDLAKKQAACRKVGDTYNASTGNCEAINVANSGSTTAGGSNLLSGDPIINQNGKPGGTSVMNPDDCATGRSKATRVSGAMGTPDSYVCGFAGTPYVPPNNPGETRNQDGGQVVDTVDQCGARGGVQDSDVVICNNTDGTPFKPSNGVVPTTTNTKKHSCSITGTWVFGVVPNFGECDSCHWDSGWYCGESNTTSTPVTTTQQNNTSNKNGPIYKTNANDCPGGAGNAIARPEQNDYLCAGESNSTPTQSSGSGNSWWTDFVNYMTGKSTPSGYGISQ